MNDLYIRLVIGEPVLQNLCESRHAICDIPSDENTFNVYGKGIGTRCAKDAINHLLGIRPRHL